MSVSLILGFFIFIVFSFFFIFGNFLNLLIIMENINILMLLSCNVFLNDYYFVFLGILVLMTIEVSLGLVIVCQLWSTNSLSDIFIL
uniref:NADH dehydrogenase subunit 4L n=1 Tax=Neomazocraes dorosomatis TaxID=1131909 RepID=A0A3G0WZC3_9PLAT|nr:NADH dehydrogenase subunit 4L [Neomazocraes dorosomatis]